MTSEDQLDFALKRYSFAKIDNFIILHIDARYNYVEPYKSQSLKVSQASWELKWLNRRLAPHLRLPVEQEFTRFAE